MAYLSEWVNFFITIHSLLFNENFKTDWIIQFYFTATRPDVSWSVEAFDPALATRVVASVIGVYSAILASVLLQLLSFLNFPVVDVPAVASVPDIAGVLLAFLLLETLLTFRLLTVSLLLLAFLILLKCCWRPCCWRHCCRSPGFWLRPCSCWRPLLLLLAALLFLTYLLLLAYLLFNTSLISCCCWRCFQPSTPLHMA